MKKTLHLIILITLFCSSLISFAQTEKGKYLIGASTTLNAGVIEHSRVVDNVSILEERITRFSVNPYAGYFIKDNLALGSEIVVSLANTKDYDYEDELRETTLAFLLFVRQYFGAKKIKPFVHASGGVGSYKEKYTSTYSEYNYDSTLTIFNYGVSAGVGFFLNDKASIDLELGYGRISTKTENDSKAKQNSYGLNAGFSLFF